MVLTYLQFRILEFPLIGGLEHEFYFSIIYGIILLTIFQDGSNHQPLCVSWYIDKQEWICHFRNGIWQHSWCLFLHCALVPVNALHVCSMFVDRATKNRDSSSPLPIGSMYAIYGNIYHQYTPAMLAYIPAPWILWDSGVPTRILPERWRLVHHPG